MSNDPRRTTPPSWASLYDDQNADMNVFGDLGPSHHPDDRSTAARIGREYRHRTVEAAQAQRLAILTEDAEVYADEQAHQRVRDDLAHGREPAKGDQIRAARAVARDPNRPRRSTAEQLAAPVMSRRR
jgi:hypothetical protein